jgi:hypothetical protein
VTDAPAWNTPLKSRTFGWLLAWGVATGVAGSGCHAGPATVQAELAEAGRLAADLRIQFSKAADASNRAVMADTDEVSIRYAREAEQSSATVDRDVAALNPLLHGLGVDSEVQILDRFQKRFSEYRVVDREVLALAVENTNLKAQRLSFGAARDAFDRFKAALDPVLPSLAANEHCRAQGLVGDAVSNVREVELLQGPHIAATEDATMTAIEQKMATLDTKTAADLDQLRGLVDPSSLSAAQTAFDQLKKIRIEIVTLSRRNSNLRSLDLSLRIKPPLATACDDTARELQSALANEGSKATR